jgi:hypothetical protein
MSALNLLLLIIVVVIQIFIMQSAFASILQLRIIVERTVILMQERVIPKWMDTSVALLGIVIPQIMESQFVDVLVNGVSPTTTVLAN